MSDLFFRMVLSAAVFVIVVSFYSYFVMRIRLTVRAPSTKLARWMRGSDEVANAYEELFPGSYLPHLSRYGFWAVIVAAGVVLAYALWRR